nr:hypothetical protein [Tanacetum cinerariifolium]
MPFMEEGGSDPSLSNLQHFMAAVEFPMIHEEAKLQMQEANRLADLKAEREKDDPLPITKFNYRVATTADKLRLPPPPQLTAFKLPPAEKKKKRRVEMIHEVLVKKNLMIDGMQRNLVSPTTVVGSAGLVIREPEAEIFVYNGSFDFDFQRKSEFYLATTARLIRIQNAIKVDLVIAREMYDEMIYVTEVRPDFIEKLGKLYKRI